MITEINEPVLTAKQRKESFGNFSGLARVLRNNSSTWVFREVFDETEKKELIKLRSEHYGERHIKESKINDIDPFDIGARFFVLNGKENGQEYVSKCIRAVNRKTQGILPSELSLLSLEELFQFSEKFSHDKDYKCTWKKSTIDDIGRRNIVDLLRKYEDSDKIYEIGGLFGLDPSLTSPLVLMLGIGKIGYDEKWDLVLQTQHPRHAVGYHCIGFPYKEIAGHSQSYEDEKGEINSGYKDYTDRPAITLALEGDRFRKRYERIHEKLGQVFEYS